MSRIHLKLEIQDKYGSVIKSFFKNIETDYTPTKEMVFTGEDYTLQARNIYFDLEYGAIFVRFVEFSEASDWDFLLKKGWEKARL